MQCDFEYESQGVKVVCPFSALPGGRRCPGHVPEIRNGQAQAMHEHQWEHKQPTTIAVPFQGLRLRKDAAGLGVGSGKAADAVQSQARTFTREEVLTVLRAQKVLISTTLGKNEADIVLGSIITIFERME